MPHLVTRCHQLFRRGGLFLVLVCALLKLTFKLLAVKLIRYKINCWSYDTKSCKNPWKPELCFTVFHMVATSMFGSSLCHNKGGFGLRCETELEMSHVVLPALQVSSWRWFWLTAGGTNLSWSVRLLRLVFFPLLTVVCSMRPQSGEWLLSGTREAATAWTHMCCSLARYRFCCGWRHHPGLDLPAGCLASITVAWGPDLSACEGGRN